MQSQAKLIGGASLAIALALGLAAYAVSSDAEASPGHAPPTRAPHAAIAAKFAAVMMRPDPELTVRSILPIEGPMKYGEWHWDAEKAGQKGQLIVTVDLQARTISAFKGGHEIGAAVAMLGTDEHPTPVGSFPILTKERHNVSEKYGNAPMPWTLRLTWDGVAIHGGSEVQNGYASHGCIAVPDQFADRLFDVAAKGDMVIITDGKRLGVGDGILG